MNYKIADLLGCEYPILMGGMQWITKADFVANVANGGGFAFISASSFSDPQELAFEIEKTHLLTDKPFGVNLSMLPGTDSSEIINGYMDVIIREKVTVIETSGRSPRELVDKAKNAGIKVLHKVTSVRHAISAEKLGVDAIVAVGYEAGGHPGMSQVGTFVTLPSVLSAVNVPVIAAGGIHDGRSMAASMVLGACGVLMGTRFLATKEAPIHNDCKNWIVKASEADTIIVQRTIRNALRCIKNNHALYVLGLESTHATFEELYPFISGKLGKDAWETGITEGALLAIGQCIGTIQDIPSVGELISRIIRDARKATYGIEL